MYVYFYFYVTLPFFTLFNLFNLFKTFLTFFYPFTLFYPFYPSYPFVLLLCHHFYHLTFYLAPCPCSLPRTLNLTLALALALTRTLTSPCLTLRYITLLYVTRGGEEDSTAPKRESSTTNQGKEGKQHRPKEVREAAPSEGVGQATPLNKGEGERSTIITVKNF